MSERQTTDAQREGLRAELKAKAWQSTRHGRGAKPLEEHVCWRAAEALSDLAAAEARAELFERQYRQVCQDHAVVVAKRRAAEARIRELETAALRLLDMLGSDWTDSTDNTGQRYPSQGCDDAVKALRALLTPAPASAEPKEQSNVEG